VAPTPSEPGGFNPNDLVGARRVLDHFIATHRIDPNRIVVHGFATGGAFASIFSSENREVVRGLALASSPVVGAPPDSHPNYPLRFFLSCGAQERLVERLRRVADVLRGMKFPVTLQTTQGRERVYPGAEDIAELARWIDSLDRI
jgi:poly(3-hydroxybutyrate) depolymerase